MNRNQMIAMHYYRRLEEDEQARRYFEEQKKKEEADQLTRQEQQIDQVCDPLQEVQEVTLIETENFFNRIINKLKFWKR